MVMLFDQKLEWAVACRLMSIPNIEFRLPGSVLATATAVSFHARASRRDRVRVGEEVVFLLLLSPVNKMRRFYYKLGHRRHMNHDDVDDTCTVDHKLLKREYKMKLS
jgi:hypothetical protein